MQDHLKSKAQLIEELNSLRQLLAERIDENKDTFRFKTLFETMSLGVIYQNLRTEVVDANPAAARILGLTRQQLIGRTSFDPRWQSRHEDGSDYPAAAQPAVLALQTGRPVNQEVIGIFNHQKGVYVWVRCNALPLFRPGESRPFQVLTTIEDLSAQKQAEQALRESDERLRMALSKSEIVFFKMDRELRYTWLYNPHNPLPPEAVLGQTDEDLFPPDEAARLAEVKWRVIHTGAPERLEISLTINSQPYYFDLTLEPVYNPTGEVTGLIGAVMDITSHKQVKIALSESEERFLQIANNIEDVFWLADWNTRRFLYISPSVERICGQPMERLYEDAACWLNWVHPEDRARVTQAYFNDLQIRGHDQVYRIVRPDGRLLWVHDRAFLVDDPASASPRLAGICHDITDLTLAESNLRDSEIRLRAILDAIQDLVFSISPDLKLLVANRSVQEVLKRNGFKPLIPGDAFDAFGLSESLVDIWKEYYLRAFNGEILAEELPVEWQGQQGLLECRLTPILTADGRCSEVVVCIHDASGHHRTEAAIRTALEEKEVLLRELHHRTKNNMQMISAILGVQASYADDARVIRAFKDVEQRILTMSLVHEKLYRSENLTQIDLQEYLYNLTDLILSGYRNKPDDVLVQFELEKVCVSVDQAIPIGLIVNELISNALNHAFPGGSAGEVRLQVALSNPQELELLVSDNGQGVPNGFDFHRDGKMGLETVFSLGEKQLQGKVTFIPCPGVTCRVQIPLND